MSKAFVQILETSKTITLAIVRTNSIAWLLLVVAVPIAIAVAIDTICYSSQLYVADLSNTFAQVHESMTMPITKHENIYLCYFNIVVNNKKLSYAATVLANIDKPCIGLDVYRSLGVGKVVVELESETINVEGVCKQSWLSPFIALPINITNPMKLANTCSFTQLSLSQNTLLKMSQLLTQDTTSALLLIKNYVLIAYLPVFIPAANNVLHRVSAVVKALRIAGVPKTIISLSLIISEEVVALLSAAIGVAVGVIASHLALTIASSIAVEVPYRPLVLSNTLVYAIYAVAALLVATVVALRIGENVL